MAREEDVDGRIVHQVEYDGYSDRRWWHMLDEKRKKENRQPKGGMGGKKKENRRPKGGMGGRYTATTQGFFKKGGVWC